MTSVDLAGAVVRTRPANVAVIGQYNVVRRADGTRDASLETFFARDVDGPAAPALRQLARRRVRNLSWERHFDRSFIARERRNFDGDGFRAPGTECWSVPLDGRQRSSVARYIASMLVRVPSYKDELNSRNMIANVGRVLGLEGVDAVEAADELHVEILVSHLNDYARRLEQCAWLLVATSGQELLFGDTPVIPAALGYGEAEAIFPVSPTRALLMVRGHRPPVRDSVMIVESTPAACRSINKTILQNAERQVFCRAPVDVALVLKHIGSRQVRLQADVDTAAGRHTLKGPLLP